MKKIFAVAALIISSPIFAQQDTSVKTLESVVVTAVKTPIKQWQTGKVINVIDQATIQRNIGKTTSEILNYQAGIFINGANNALGTNQDVYFRGASTGNVLILIDNIPVGDPSQINNTFDLNTISPSQIERIEILKGAQSTIWGSDAVAGVINIITKRGSVKKFRPNLLLSYGSYHTFRGSLGVNGATNNFDYSLSYTRTNSRGFTAARDTTHIKNFERDGFEQNNFQANLGYRINSVLSVRGLAQYGKYSTDIDASAFADDKDYVSKTKQGLYSIDLRFTPKKLDLHFLNSYQKSRRDLIDDSTSVGGFAKYSNGFYKARTITSELYGSYQLFTRGAVVGGVQSVWQNTDQGFLSISSFGPFKTALGNDSARIDMQSAYASFLLTNISGFSLEVGGRLNHHSIYKNYGTFSFNPSYFLDDRTKVFVNISSAYKVPSLYQLYSEYGNKDLKPEKSKNYEFGFQFFGEDKGSWFRVLGFKRDIKNLIVFYTNPSTFASKYINRDEQHDYGFEFESNVSIRRSLTWITNFTYVDGEGQTGTVKTRNLYRRPNFTANTMLTAQLFRHLTVMPSFRFVSSRTKGIYDPGPAVLPQYYNINLYTGFDFFKGLRAFIDLRNVTDQKYIDIPGYNTRGFNVTGGVSWSL